MLAAFDSERKTIGPPTIQTTSWMDIGPVDQYSLSIGTIRPTMVLISDDKDPSRATEGFHGLTRLTKTTGPDDHSEFRFHIGFFADQGISIDKFSCTRHRPGKRWF